VELRTHRRIEPHELGDHDQGHVDRELGDELDLAAVLDLVEDAVGDLADVGGETADLAWREPAVDDRSLALVLGVVHREDRQRDGVAGSHPVLRAVELGVSRDVTHLGMAADQPAPGLLAPVGGVVLTQPAVGLPRIVERTTTGEVGDRHRHDASSAGTVGRIVGPLPGRAQGRRSRPVGVAFARG